MDSAHYAGLALWSPLATSSVERTLAGWQAQGPVLDIGCGNGALLRWLHARHGVEVIGLDRAEDALTEARELLPSGRWVAGDAQDFAPEQPVAMVCCVGGPHLGGTLETHLDTLQRWVRPGGTVLVGEGFWKSLPPPEYVAATGIAVEDLPTWAQLTEMTHRQGWRRAHTHVSTRAEWHAFEGGILRTREAAGPSPALDAYQVCHDAQQRWGRQCMGFVLHRFETRGHQYTHAR